MRTFTDFLNDIKAEGIAEGIAKGIAKGKAESEARIKELEAQLASMKLRLNNG